METQRALPYEDMDETVACVQQWTEARKQEQVRRAQARATVQARKKRAAKQHKAAIRAVAVDTVSTLGLGAVVLALMVQEMIAPSVAVPVALVCLVFATARLTRYRWTGK